MFPTFWLSVTLGALSEAFLFSEKPFLCFKVCPLYCSQRRRRSYDDVSTFWAGHDPYETFHPFPEIYQGEPAEPIAYRFGYYIPCKTTTTTPAPTTKAPAPTTTTEEPSGICIICKKNCDLK